MAQIGSTGAYNEKEEEFKAYIARMKHYFKANDVAEKQVSALLTLIGHKGFTLANNQLLPKSLDEYNFDEIVDTILSHYNPKQTVIFE